MAFSLACFGIRSRKRRRLILHETAFTRWRFLLSSYSIDVDTFYLFLNWFSTRISDDQKYVRGRVYRYTKIQRPFDDSEKLHHCQRSKKWFAWHVISIIAENTCKRESLQHPTIAVLLIKILIFFRPLSSVHLFQSNQCLQAIEFVDRHVPEKL